MDTFYVRPVGNRWEVVDSRTNVSADGAKYEHKSMAFYMAARYNH